MKKFLCLLLTVMLIFQMTTPAFSYTLDTIGNTQQVNQTILEKLRDLYGGNITEDDIVNELSDMGLLDDEGNINVSESIMVDGTPMTLIQVKAMLNSSSTDLSKEVSVDGTVLTLSDLKTMIEIEDELGRIKETYFSNAVPFTEDHNESFDSLLNQIQNNGIMLGNSISGENTEISINHEARIKATVSSDKMSTDINQVVTVDFTLTDNTGNPLLEGLDYDVQFDWKLADGSALKGTHYSVGYDGVSEGTVTIAAGQTSTVAYVNITWISSSENTINRWKGDKVFLIELYNPVNILFEGGTSSKDIPISISNSYTWTTAVSYEDNNIEMDFGGDLGERLEPCFVINVSYNYEIKNKLLRAVDDIFGGIDDASFELYYYMQMNSGTNASYDMTNKPLLLDDSRQPIANSQYMAIDDSIHYLRYFSYDEQPEVTFHINSVNEVDLQTFERWARCTGIIPFVYEFSNASYSPEYPSNEIYVPFRHVSFSILDEKAPKINSITAPASDSSDEYYYSGQTVPITVEFSEPVKAGEAKIKLQGQNTAIPSAESSGTISKYATFLYTVPKNPDPLLRIGSVYNVEDMSGNTTSSSSITTVGTVKMKIDPVSAFQGLSVENVPTGGLYASDDLIDVKLSVDSETSLWLENDYDLTKDQLKSVYLKAGGYTYPLKMGGEGSEEGSYYTAEIPAVNYSDITGQTVKIELYRDGTYNSETNLFSGGNIVIGMCALAETAPLVLAENINIDTNSYPVNNIVYLTDTKTTMLKASISPETATFTDIEWESSDESVALIDKTTGIITPVSQGTVKFRAISDNCGFGAEISAETPIFTIADGGPPAIVFQEGNNAFITKKNEEATIAWNQNLIGRTEGVIPEFTVEIYDGYYSDIAQLTGTPVYTDAVYDKNTYTIPSNILSNVSMGTDPAYTVKVSSNNPDNTSQVLSAIGYIIVYPQPAKVKLDKLDSYYITDETKSVDIDWSVSEFTGGEFEFKITKNKTVIYTDTSSTDSGSHKLSIDSVPSDSLKDIYTVTIKAKNTQDSGWSTDSFVLNVYNRNSLNIQTDNQDQEAVSMDNNSYIKNLYEDKGSEGILDLDRNIYLKKYIGINYSQYPWGSITDQIKWSSENSKIASVNYRQGNLYENVETYNYSSYRPSTEFMLAGNSDGDTVITATHAATGMKDTVNVNVTTLKDKLYIFNFYPKQETSIAYVNGNGEARSLITDSKGEIAIYEENGIASDITLKSGSSDNLYLGTLYNNKLISAEGNPGIYELYPVNSFKLRPAAKVKLFFKNSDGEPYTSQVTYRGAVYKNGKICTETMEQKGAQLDLGSDGRFTLNLDSTKFWVNDNSEELHGSDKLEFIYEIIFADDYYPQLLTVNGNISVDDAVRFGESVINLRTVSSENKNKPFILKNAVNYNLSDGRTIDVTNYKGSIGPGNTYPTADLETTVAWWGKDKIDGYDVKVEDEYGSVIAGQRVKTILYPFATLAYTKNITTMNDSTLALGIGEKKGAATSLYGTDGSLLKHIESPFTFSNMVGAPAANDESKGVKSAVEDLNESGNLKFDASSMNTGDKVIGKALDLMSGTSLGGQIMNLSVLATEDPLVYHGLITMYQGMGNTDASSVEVNIGGVDGELDYTPDAAEMMDLMQKSTDDIAKELDENMEKTVSGGVDYGLSITGYFEVEVRYDEDAGNWIIIVIGGGFDVDSIIGYTWTMNSMVGPVPITAEFGLGAAAKLEFRAIKPYGNVPANIDAADVNDFFTALRLNFYAKAFGGFGFDYSVVAVKIGVFGQINVLYNSEFLNRSYLYPHPNGYDKIFAMDVSLKGQVGIKFVAKLLFISYEQVLASMEYSGAVWEEGNPELIDDWKNSQNSSLITSLNGGMYNNKIYLNSTRLQTVRENIGIESRDYLSLYDRTWESGNKLRMKMLSSSNVKDIQTNAYPYANPTVTRDGSILAYMSDSGSTDVNETRASWAVLNSGHYVDQGPLPQVSSETAFADNNLKLDGTGNFAVAAWEQQGVKITTSGSITYQGISAMMNTSDIMTSVYDSGTWTTSCLTDNMVPDISPVTAANDGRAVVAWRSVAGSNMTEDPFNYDDKHDTILYKIYENGSWSETYTLYNGTSGNVKGLSAAMMSDGTAGIAYTLDCGTDSANPAFGYETVFSVIGIDNSVVNDIRLTNNDSVDENPQVTAVNFEEPGGGISEKFVIGWHNVTAQGISDIKLAASDNKGTLYDGFIDSISSINENSKVKITDKFRFVKGENLNIEDLSLLWAEPSLEYNKTLNTNAEKDCLKAVKFMKDKNGKIYLTGALDVADMDDYTLIDHFDAYTLQNNTVDAVILASSYTGELVDEGGGVYTVGSVSSMKSASAEYSNDINIDNIYMDYGEIKNDFIVPIQFTAVNMGINPINSVSITLLPDNVTKTFDNLNLLPNQCQVLTVDYQIPDETIGIHDLNYTVSAVFSGNDVIEKGGMLNLDIPDTGISKVELISDEQGKRVIQATLHNISDVDLANNPDRKVYVGFYTSSEYTDESKVDVQEITGSDLTLLDESALTMRFSYTVPSKGVPNGGIRLYAKIWAEEKKQDNSYEEITEYNQSNNERSILLPNPIEANNGEQFLVSVEQENNTDNTTALVTVKNLSMEPSFNGNVMAYMLDDKGNIIESKMLATLQGDLLNLSGEESITKSIAFSGRGAKVIAKYFTADPNTMNAEISDIKLVGISMDFKNEITDYTLDSTNIDTTNILAVAKKPGDMVEIRDASSKLLASGLGSAVYMLKLSKNSSPAKVQIAAANIETGQTSDTYNISIANTSDTNGAVILSTEEYNYRNASITVSADGLVNFTPVKWQYMKDGTWSEIIDWNLLGTNKFVISGTGTYSVSARLFDENGYYMDSNNMMVLVRSSSSNGKDKPNESIEEPDSTITSSAFADVAEDAWYFEAINYLASLGIINGVGNDNFAPEANITRADFLIMVMNAYGITIDETDKTYGDNFSDAGNKYYSAYLGKAKQMGLVSGVGENIFSPENLINRQDMAVILYRILYKIGKLPAGTDGMNFEGFSDTLEISDYAIAALKVFAEAGILSGYDNMLYPNGLSTRAQAAQILYNLLK